MEMDSASATENQDMEMRETSYFKQNEEEEKALQPKSIGELISITE